MTVAEFVVVCKVLVEVQVATVVKWAKYYQDLVLYYVQARQDVVDLLIQAVQDVEVMHVRQLVVAMEHIFVYVHQEAVTDVALVTLERLQEHTVVAQLTFADVFTGQTLQFADFTEAEQVHQCVQVQPSN